MGMVKDRFWLSNGTCALAVCSNDDSTTILIKATDYVHAFFP